MRAYELEEYQTKSGEEIDFKYKEDAEGDKNRGWISHQIDAYVKGDYAGYIAIGYIPKDRFKEHYPTVLNFMDKMGGKHILSNDKKNAHYKDLNDEDLKQAIQGMAYHTKYHNIWNSGGKEGMPETREELIAIIEDIIKNEHVGKDETKKFKEFAKYHVDKPIVDYISVFKENQPRDNRRSLKRGETLATSPQDYRRQYIGTALYLEAAEYLKKKGLKLHASGLQQPEAEQAWAKFEKEGRVKSDGDRRWLEI